MTILLKFIQYKTAILMFNLFHGTLPIHLQSRVAIYSVLGRAAAIEYTSSFTQYFGIRTEPN